MGTSEREMTLELQRDEWKAKAAKYREKWLRRAKELKREIIDLQELLDARGDELTKVERQLGETLRDRGEALRKVERLSDEVAELKRTNASLVIKSDEVIARYGSPHQASSSAHWAATETARLDAVAGLVGVLDVLIGQREREKVVKFPIVDVKRLVSDVISHTARAKHPDGADPTFKIYEKVRALGFKFIVDYFAFKLPIAKAFPAGFADGSSDWAGQSDPIDRVFHAIQKEVRSTKEWNANRQATYEAVRSTYQLLTGASFPPRRSFSFETRYGDDNLYRVAEEVLEEVRRRGIGQAPPVAPYGVDLASLRPEPSPEVESPGTPPPEAAEKPLRPVYVVPGSPLSITRDRVVGVDIGIGEEETALVVIERQPDGTDRIVHSEKIADDTEMDAAVDRAKEKLRSAELDQHAEKDSPEELLLRSIKYRDAEGEEDNE